jgi:hypothetical protein
LIDIVDDCINRIITDEDSGIISGDQLKAYGRENLYSFVELDEGYNCIPLYHKEVMEQMHNMRFIEDVNAVWLNDAATAAAHTQNTFRLEQVDNTLISVPVLTATRDNSTTKVKNLWSFKEGIYDSLVDQPEPNDVMVGSRFMFTLPTGVASVEVHGISVPNGNVRAGFLDLIPTSVGSEIVITPYALITSIPSGDLYGIWSDDPSQCMMPIDQSSNVNSTQLFHLSSLTKLDWSPLVYTLPDTFTDTITFATSGVLAQLSNIVTNVEGDLYNYTEITEPVLRLMNETALLREFTIPITTIA